MNLRYLSTSLQSEEGHGTMKLQVLQGTEWKDVPVVDAASIAEQDRLESIAAKVAVQEGITPAKAKDIFEAFQDLFNGV